ADITHSELELGIEADNPWFEGHFPGQPILPGVVQIGWAVHFAHTLHGLGPEVANLEQIKFRRPIFPGTRLTLQLTPSADGQKLRYEYRDAEASYSSGTLDYGTAA
ncbi:MAG: 3-hydroxyacyl-ACP dehydratase FabZ family protein, partial [Gammaproteobacteria bacterium]